MLHGGCNTARKANPDPGYRTEEDNKVCREIGPLPGTLRDIIELQCELDAALDSLADRLQQVSSVRPMTEVMAKEDPRKEMPHSDLTEQAIRIKCHINQKICQVRNMINCLEL